MGCDIHFYVEQFINGNWQSADKWSPDEYAEEKPKKLTVAYGDHIYDDRNYSLFAILADVRNDDDETGKGYKPISLPRGLPLDVCALVKDEAEEDGGHSHSWLTVSELLAYDWTQTTIRRGFVSAAEYWKWNRFDRGEGESPSSFCRGVGGGRTRIVTESEMEALIHPYGEEWSAKDSIQTDLPHVYCKVEWVQPYYKTARKFLSDCMPRLWQLGKPDDTRIVFWFDS